MRLQDFTLIDWDLNSADYRPQPILQAYNQAIRRRAGRQRVTARFADIVRSSVRSTLGLGMNNRWKGMR